MEKLKCCWLPATAHDDLYRHGMSQGDQRAWMARYGCNALPTWQVHTGGDPYYVTHSCDLHLGEMCVGGDAVNTVWPIDAEPQGCPPRQTVWEVFEKEYAVLKGAAVSSNSAILVANGEAEPPADVRRGLRLMRKYLGDPGILVDVNNACGWIDRLPE